MDSILFLILLQVILILLNAIFASAEIAVLSINETKIEHMAQEGNARAKRLFHLTREPEKFLATIQVAITLSGFLGSAFAAENFSDPLVNALLAMGLPIPRATLDTIAVIFITLVLSYFTLIFGELVPKRIAMKKSEELSMAISGLISMISVAFKPVVWFLSVSTNTVLRICGIDPTQEEENIGEEEIRLMVDASSEKGTIEHQEKEFIENVFAFNDITVGDIATHRTDVDLLWLEDDLDTWAKTIHDCRHTRFPICDGSVDQVVGILNAKDFFRLEHPTKTNVMENAVSAPYFVPETVKADVLFENMKKNRKSFAVIMDEYGGMVGIVTFYDLIEELVGKLHDDPEDMADTEPYLEQVDATTWKIYGNISLRDMQEVTGFDLTGEDYDTFTGFVFHLLGMVPDDGEQNIQLHHENLSIHVNSIADHQVAMATIALEDGVHLEEIS